MRKSFYKLWHEIKKRPQYLQRLVDRTNMQLARTREKDACCDLICVVEDILLNADCYKGYNFYKYKEDGTLVLNGTPLWDKNENPLFDCIQLY